MVPANQTTGGPVALKMQKCCNKVFDEFLTYMIKILKLYSWNLDTVWLKSLSQGRWWPRTVSNLILFLKYFSLVPLFWLMASLFSKLSYKETWATTVLMASFTMIPSHVDLPENFLSCLPFHLHLRLSTIFSFLTYSWYDRYQYFYHPFSTLLHSILDSAITWLFWN